MSMPKIASPELVQHHYMMMTATILSVAAKHQMPIEEVIRKAVAAFGLVPLATDSRKYELVPEIREMTDKAAELTGVPRLPDVFSEDQAILFCAVSTAQLQVDGKLGQIADELEARANEANEAEMSQAAQETAAVQRNTSKARPSGDDGGSGPTYH